MLNERLPAVCSCASHHRIYCPTFCFDIINLQELRGKYFSLWLSPFPVVFSSTAPRQLTRGQQNVSSRQDDTFVEHIYLFTLFLNL